MVGRGARVFGTLSVMLLLTACGRGQEHTAGHTAPDTTAKPPDTAPKPLMDAVAATERARTVTGTYAWETKGLPALQGRFAIQRAPFAASARDGSEYVIAVGGDGYKTSTAFGGTKWTKVALRPPGGNAAPGSPDKVTQKITEIDPLANVRFFAAASKDFRTLSTGPNENGSTRHFSGALLGLEFDERKKVRDTSVPDPRGPNLLSSKDSFEVWTDDRLQVRKFVITSDNNLRLTVTVTAYDQPTSIKAPSAARTEPGS
jgi:hypothetical protein